MSHLNSHHVSPTRGQLPHARDDSKGTMNMEQQTMRVADRDILHPPHPDASEKEWLEYERELEFLFLNGRKRTKEDGPHKSFLKEFEERQEEERKKQAKLGKTSADKEGPIIIDAKTFQTISDTFPSEDNNPAWAASLRVLRSRTADASSQEVKEDFSQRTNVANESFRGANVRRSRL